MDSFLQIGQSCGADKVTYHGYHFFYPRFLEPLRNEQFNMLEIGYDHGNSYKMWEKYFPNAKVFAMDREDTYLASGHLLLKGDQGSLQSLAEVANTIGTAKFIVDDGSHHPVHQIETFSFLFQNLLLPGGVYIIEDIETNYWSENSDLYGYRIGNSSCIDYCKKLVEQINSMFSGQKNKLNVSSITFGQNCVIITKQTVEEFNYFNRSYKWPEKLNYLS